MPIAARRRISRRAGSMLLAAAVVGGGIGLGSATMVFAAPRYVAVCPTAAEGDCATISAHGTAGTRVSSDTAVVALGGTPTNSLTISNNHATGSAQLTIVGFFDAVHPSGGSEFSAADAATKVTVELEAGESRDVAVPGLPSWARSVLVKLSSGGTGAAGGAPGIARVDVATGSALMTAREVLAALEDVRKAGRSASPKPTAGKQEHEPAPPIDELVDEVTAETSQPVAPRPDAGRAAPGRTEAGAGAGTAEEPRGDRSDPTSSAASKSSRSSTASKTSTAPAQQPAPAPSATSTPTPAPKASAPAPKPAEPPAPATQPTGTGGGTSGAPSDGRLTVVQGDVVVTVAGTVIDSKDIHGRVIVKAPNVTIKNSVIRGADSGSRNGLIDAMAAHGGLLVVDTEVFAANPNPYVNGIMGHNFELRRVNIHSVIDHVHLTGGNVTIADSRLHSNLHYANDPNHSDGSHDDSIQVQAGDNIRISGNSISGAHNAAIMVTQDRGPVSNLSISGNTIDGGACTINIAEKSHGPLRGTSIVDNTFGRSTRHANCAVLAPTTTNIDLRNNHYTDGAPVTVRKG